MGDLDETTENNTVLYVIIFCIGIVIIYMSYESLKKDNFTSVSIVDTSPTFDPYLIIINPEYAKNHVNTTPATLYNIFNPTNSNNMFYVSYYVNFNNANYQYTTTSNSIIVYDFVSMNSLSSIFMTILYYTGTTPGTIFYTVPQYTSSLSGTNITFNSTLQKATINPNSYYLIYFIPITPVSTLPSITSSNYNSMNNNVYNTTSNINYNGSGFANSFNIYVYNSSPNTIAINRSAGNPAIQVNPNTFNYIYNKENNGTWGNCNKTEIQQYGIIQV